MGKPREEREAESSWLTLGEAARVLGVDATTLRTWADAGKVRVFRTPGGHRRFDRGALDALLGWATSSAPPATPRHLAAPFSVAGTSRSRQWLAGRTWYAAVSDHSRARVRAYCTELMQMVVARGPEGNPAPGREASARRVGSAIGREAAAWGLSPAQSTEVFLHFKRQATDAVAAWGGGDGDRLRSVRDVEALLGNVLQAMMEAYESVPRRSATRAGGRSS